MRDNFWRRVVKRVALARYTIDLQATRLIERRRTPVQYSLCGACNGCGACCESPMIATNRWFFHSRTVRWWVLWWHRVINGFELMAQDRESYTYTFRCTHYDPATRLCDSYDSRPGMCRDYPLNLIFTYRPEFLPECGYYALHVDADDIRVSLEELPDLTPEKRERLAREFYVWEPPAAWSADAFAAPATDLNLVANPSPGHVEAPDSPTVLHLMDPSAPSAASSTAEPPATSSGTGPKPAA